MPKAKAKERQRSKRSKSKRSQDEAEIIYWKMLEEKVELSRKRILRGILKLLEAELEI